LRTYPTQRDIARCLRLDTILKHIKKKSMTVHDIAELVEVRYATAKQYINELHKSGKVHIAKYERTKAAIRPVYKFGYAEDAEKLKRLPHSYYDQKRPKRPYRPRNKSHETNTKPRRDVAASWF